MATFIILVEVKKMKRLFSATRQLVIMFALCGCASIPRSMSTVEHKEANREEPQIAARASEKNMGNQGDLRSQLVNQIDAQLAVSNFDAAKPLLKRLCDEFPPTEYGHSRYADVLLRSGETQRARQTLAQLVQTALESGARRISIESAVLYADLSLESDAPADAKVGYALALKAGERSWGKYGAGLADSFDLNVMRSRAYLSLAFSRRMKGDRVKCIEFVDKAMQLTSSDPVVAYYVWHLKGITGQPDEALAKLAQLRELLPTSSPLLPAIDANKPILEELKRQKSIRSVGATP